MIHIRHSNGAITWTTRHSVVGIKIVNQTNHNIFHPITDAPIETGESSEEDTKTEGMRIYNL